MPDEDCVPTVDLLKHFIHAFDVIVVQEPRLAVFFIFFEWYTERIGNVYDFAVVLSKENTNYAFM